MHRSYHTSRLRGLLALLTLVALLGLPLQAFAAKGSDLTGESEALTPLIGAGQLLAFRVSFENTGNSTITQFRFDGKVAGAAAFDSNSSSDCSYADGIVSCVRGPNLPSGDYQEWLLVFQAPASAGTVALTDAAFRGDAKSGTPGAKQDTWPVAAQTVTALASGTPDFYSQLRLTGAGGGTPSVGSDQKSQVTHIPPQGKAYGVSLRHTDAAITCGPPRNYFGETVEVNVANGQSAVTVQITFARTPGLSPSNARVVHQSDSGCDVPPTDCVANPTHCQSAEYVGAGSNRRVQVTVYLPHNGSIKGFR